MSRKSIDLTRLELILEDGRTENLCGRHVPLRFFFGEHEDALRSFYYKAGRLEHIGSALKVDRSRAWFFSSLWPPPKQATLMAKGTVHRNTDEDQPFRQVSVWRFNRYGGFRKVYVE